MAKIIFIAFVALLAACASAPQVSKTSKTSLLVSIAPYQSLVQEIAGDDFEVLSVVPQNADPHTYEPNIGQLTKTSAGKIWFQIGEPFEKKLSSLLPNTRAIDLRDDISMIEMCGHYQCGHNHGDTRDRHLWLSPKVIATQASRIAEALGQTFPDGKTAFFERAARVQEKCRVLDIEIEKRLQDATSRTFLVAHAAFAYFCRDYQCVQLPIEQEGKEPGPRAMEQILRAAKKQNASFAIAIPQHPSKGVGLIAKKLHIPVQSIDPYAADPLETIRALSLCVQ